MIWVWLYLASILPGILIAAFVLGRMGCGRLASCTALIIGAFWPVVLPIMGLTLLVERAIKMGEASNPCPR